MLSFCEYPELSLLDSEIISQHIEKFYEDQYLGAQERTASGGPVGDIFSAMACIRQIMPELDQQAKLRQWIPYAMEIIMAERQKFRDENDDEAGWGSATFSEMAGVLYVLLQESS